MAAVATMAVDATGSSTVSTTLCFFFDRCAFLPATPGPYPNGAVCHPHPMTVYLVGAGPGDPGLITVRGAEVLARADVVVYDRLSVASLLDLAPSAAERISVGKAPGRASLPQPEI